MSKPPELEAEKIGEIDVYGIKKKKKPPLGERLKYAWDTYMVPGFWGVVLLLVLVAIIGENGDDDQENSVPAEAARAVQTDQAA